MLYITDDLSAILKSCNTMPIMNSERISPKEVRKLFKLYKEINNTLRWYLYIWQNCIQTETAAKKLTKILRLNHEIEPNKDFTVKLEKGDVIIHFELRPGKPTFYLYKVKYA